MSDCRYLTGLFTDAAKQRVTSDKRAAWLQRVCPCEACKEYRASRKRLHRVRMPALPWWTPYPSPRPCAPDAAPCPYHGMARGVMARRGVVFDAGVLA